MEETLKEMTFKIWPLKVPEMTVIVSEFKIHRGHGALQRELVRISRYLFYHDKDEELAAKLHLTVKNKIGDVVLSRHYSQFSSFNESYKDDENYLYEGDYIYKDFKEESSYENEDLTGLFDDSFQSFQSEETGAVDEEEAHYQNEDLTGLFDDSFGTLQSEDTNDESPFNQILLLPSTNCDDRLPENLDLDAGPDADDGILIPESPGQEEQFKDLLSEPLLYDF